MQRYESKIRNTPARRRIRKRLNRQFLMVPGNREPDGFIPYCLRNSASAFSKLSGVPISR